MHITPRETGWIEVICGSMFSGKTEELMRRLRLATIAKQKVAVFKPKLDDRYATDAIVSHEGRRLTSRAVSTPHDVWDAVVHRGAEGAPWGSRGEAPGNHDSKPSYEVVGIDEAQFFGLDLVEVCERLADLGVRVIVSGLDQDSRGIPFEPIPQLLAVAEFITKNLAICMKCGNPSNRSQRLVERDARVMIGAHDVYEARCRRCFTLPEGEPRQKTLPLGKTTK